MVLTYCYSIHTTDKKLTTIQKDCNMEYLGDCPEHDPIGTIDIIYNDKKRNDDSLV